MRLGREASGAVVTGWSMPWYGMCRRILSQPALRLILAAMVINLLWRASAILIPRRRSTGCNSRPALLAHRDHVTDVSVASRFWARGDSSLACDRLRRVTRNFQLHVRPCGRMHRALRRWRHRFAPSRPVAHADPDQPPEAGATSRRRPTACRHRLISSRRACESRFLLSRARSHACCWRGCWANARGTARPRRAVFLGRG